MNKAMLLAAAAAMVPSVPVAAITTFATFTPTTNASNITFTTGAGGTGSLDSMAAPVTFRFLDPTGTTTVADFSAVFALTAATGPGTMAGGLGIAPSTTGDLSFTTASAVTFDGHTGTNLLTAHFTGGSLVGLVGGSVASFVTSQPPGTVTFTSDFLSFAGSTSRDIALAIDAINPSLSGGPSGLANFLGTVSGNFGADLSSGSGSDVPEPAAWVMMVAGFGLVGTIRRRTPRSVAA